jgi:hypothetical protein
MSDVDAKELEETVGAPLDVLMKHYADEHAQMKQRYETSDKIETWKKLLDRDDDELILLRFLCGKKGDVDLAWETFERSMAWREIHTPNGTGSSILDFDDEKFEETSPFNLQCLKYSPELSFSGVCKKGMPTIYELKGRMDVMGFIKNITPEEYHQRVAYNLISTFRKVNKLSREQNKLMGVCLVYCAKQVSMSHLKFMPYFKYDVDDLQLNCPEVLSDCLAINTPWFFNIFWNIIKPWLDKRTLEKIHILGADQSKLLEYIDAKYVPTALGGEDPAPKLVIPDPLQGLNKVDIGAGKKHELEIRAPAANHSISWKWQPVSKDVGFQVLFIDEEGNEEQVTDYERISATGEVFQGSFISPKSGTLRIHWDNSYSYWTGKQIMQWVGDFEEVKA